MKNLKYLFEAEYFDGTVYSQNKLDASVNFPPKPDENGQLQGRSCMADIQEDIDSYRIKRFTLKRIPISTEEKLFSAVFSEKVLGVKTITVDLTDGHFEIDANSFNVEGDRPLPVQPNQFKLIYFRVVRQNRCTPARYMNPQSAQKIGKGVEVTNSRGEKHFYEKVERTWKEEKQEIIDGKRQKVVYYFVLPVAPLLPLQYMLGWQTVIAGKTYTQKILIL